MDLNYLRCPLDTTKIISSVSGLSTSGRLVEIGLPEIASALSLKGALYATTLAIKNGVADDFVSRVATSLATQMGTDVHALCPVIGILVECMAVMTGGKAALDEKGRMNVFPSKDCPAWMKGYFNQQLGD